MIEIRPMREGDMDVVEEMGTVSYPPNYYEGSASFRSKVSGGGCLVGLVDGVLAGYLMSFPYVLGIPYPINEVYVPAGHPECHYIHDLCVSSCARGLGLGTALAEVAMSGRPMVALTAVMGSEGFWEGLGFRRQFGLDYYGGRATYMLRVLRQGSLGWASCLMSASACPNRIASDGSIDGSVVV